MNKLVCCIRKSTGYESKLVEWVYDFQIDWNQGAWYYTAKQYYTYNTEK